MPNATSADINDLKNSDDRPWSETQRKRNTPIRWDVSGDPLVVDWIFDCKPSSYGGTPIYGNPISPITHGLPSGKRLHNYGKSPFSIGKSTINGPFSIAILIFSLITMDAPMAQETS